MVLTNKGAIVIDTPWTEPQTEELIQSIQTNFQKQIVFLIVTHAHDDRMAGVPNFLKRNIPVFSTTEVVVPGHGNWGKLDLLRHTIRLLISPNH